MFKYILMCIVCVGIQRSFGKTLFDYNINPQHDLIAEESTSYSNFWPSSEFYISPVGRHKHHTKRGHNGRGNGKRGRGPPSVHSDYHYFDSSEEINHSEEYHGYPLHPNHPHGLPPGQAKKQNRPHAHPHEPTPLPFTVQQPPLTTPAVYVSPNLTTRRTTTTTPAPTSDDELIYDIDVRFGRD